MLTAWTWAMGRSHPGGRCHNSWFWPSEATGNPWARERDRLPDSDSQRQAQHQAEDLSWYRRPPLRLAPGSAGSLS